MRSNFAFVRKPMSKANENFKKAWKLSLRSTQKYAFWCHLHWVNWPHNIDVWKSAVWLEIKLSFLVFNVTLMKFSGQLNFFECQEIPKVLKCYWDIVFVSHKHLTAIFYLTLLLCTKVQYWSDNIFIKFHVDNFSFESCYLKTIFERRRRGSKFTKAIL